MNLLYLTDDYYGSKVHNNLINNLLQQDENLKVYVLSPNRGNKINETFLSSYETNERLFVFNPLIDISLKEYKFNFLSKIRCKVRLVEKNIPIPISDIDIIHAATLYSDGCTAMQLKRKYKIPYIISIRSADAFFYTNTMFHLWLIANRVILNSAAITSISGSIKKEIQKSWKYRFVRERINNCYVINNGIDKIWFENLHQQPIKKDENFKILYIGRFHKTKNLSRLISATLCLREHLNVSLTLVGGFGTEHEKIIDTVKKHNECINYLGEIYNKNELIKIIRECDIFAMPSFQETFGLVYAECLSQGLPLLYTKNTGFDGMYDEGVVGYAVDSKSVDAIADGLRKIIDNYNQLQQNISQLDMNRYSWESIAKTYLKIYVENCKPH